MAAISSTDATGAISYGCATWWIQQKQSPATFSSAANWDRSRQHRYDLLTMMSEMVMLKSCFQTSDSVINNRWYCTHALKRTDAIKCAEQNVITITKIKAPIRPISSADELGHSQIVLLSWTSDTDGQDSMAADVAPAGSLLQCRSAILCRYSWRVKISFKRPIY